MATHFFGITDRTFAYSYSIGRNEFGGTGFRNPVGLAVGDNEVIYVVNRSYENRPDGVRITVCTYNEDFIGEFGSAGTGDGQLVWPSDIAVDGDGKVYVSDEYLNRITIYDKDGNYLSKWGKPGSGEGEFNGPASLAMTGDGHVLISDAKNHRIQKYTLEGQFVAQCGSHGDGPGQFNMPWGVNVDADGNMYVADWRNDRIQKLSPEGESLAVYGMSGSGIGQFNRPSDVCVDQDGDIYVADRENNRVQILAPDGRFLTQLLGDHQMSRWGKEKLQSNPDMIRQRALAMSYDRGEFEKRFCNPCVVWVDEEQRILVVDHVRGRIQVYAKSDTPVLA
jgi:DNA-binding beta-propeller fold protein YncE